MNWFRKSDNNKQPDQTITNSLLLNEDTFYNQFVNDLLEAREEVIIESPYITKKRMNMLKPSFERLVKKGVQVFIITRDPQEHDKIMAKQSEDSIDYFEVLGSQILIVNRGHHRKLAMIDRKILWEGSLNILSQSHSREFMRRIESRTLVEEMFRFLRFDTLEVFSKKMDLYNLKQIK